MRRKNIPEVSAGSMADIAFLLLIFFLVTTTIETDAGLDRMLPPLDMDQEEIVYRDKNIFLVNINKENALLVEESPMEIRDLREAARNFLDNGGDGSCAYCQGAADPESSDNPDIAVISLKSDRETKYATYITVQNELVGAYNDLRNREAQRLYGRNFTELEAEYLNPETPEDRRELLREQVQRIQGLFPMKLSEAETSLK